MFKYFYKLLLKIKSFYLREIRKNIKRLKVTPPKEQIAYDAQFVIEPEKKESNIYKERVISLFSAVTSLGLDVGNSSQFTNLQRQNEILSKEVEKTLICLEISPADESVDLQMLWSQIIENFHMEGLTWGENYKLEPIGYGLNKLIMSCTIVDSLVNLDDITESIESLDDWVQSVTVLSMNNI
jgi:translation elongation factor EF-1beta